MRSFTHIHQTFTVASLGLLLAVSAGCSVQGESPVQAGALAGESGETVSPRVVITKPEPREMPKVKEKKVAAKKAPSPKPPAAEDVGRAAPNPTPQAEAATPAEAPTPQAPVVPAVTAGAFSPSIGAMQPILDRCIGAVVAPSPYGTLIAQHDYCGGTANLGSHAPGSKVRVGVGSGADGLYVVGQVKIIPKGSSVETLSDLGPVVLQTCIGNQMKLTGLTRISG